MATRRALAGISSFFRASDSIEASLRCMIELERFSTVTANCLAVTQRNRGSMGIGSSKVLSPFCIRNIPKRTSERQSSSLSMGEHMEIPAPFKVDALPVTKSYEVEQQDIFAVVELSGTQYKVTPDDLIVTEKLSGVDINDRIILNRVLLVGSQSKTVVGRPYIPNATVSAAIEEQFLDGKVIVFKKRRRKNSRRTNGHRQPLTSLRILSISDGSDTDTYI
eukprot:jgi/Picsp_1/3706/NSC_06542-R1_50s ribosomal protein l21